MSSEIPIKEFKPDLVVEVTMACDRKCNGCYAPTILQNRFTARPDVFLSADALKSAIAYIVRSNGDTPISNVAVRGGEPTLHPQLDKILEILRPLSSNVLLETNGNWVLAQNEFLLRVCSRLRVAVKISFDSMHSLNASDLRVICATLDRFEILWMVAITEASDAEFQAIRNRCLWISNERLFIQRKAFHGYSLIRPRLGVVHIDGQVTSQLTTKSDFLKVLPEAYDNDLNII